MAETKIDIILKARDEAGKALLSTAEGLKQVADEAGRLVKEREQLERMAASVKTNSAEFRTLQEGLAANRDRMKAFGLDVEKVDAQMQRSSVSLRGVVSGFRGLLTGFGAIGVLNLLGGAFSSLAQHNEGLARKQERLNDIMDVSKRAWADWVNTALDGTSALVISLTEGETAWEKFKNAVIASNPALLAYRAATQDTEAILNKKTSAEEEAAEAINKTAGEMEREIRAMEEENKRLTESLQAEGLEAAARELTLQKLEENTRALIKLKGAVSEEGKARVAATDAAKEAEDRRKKAEAEALAQARQNAAQRESMEKGLSEKIITLNMTPLELEIRGLRNNLDEYKKVTKDKEAIARFAAETEIAIEDVRNKAMVQGIIKRGQELEQERQKELAQEKEQQQLLLQIVGAGTEQGLALRLSMLNRYIEELKAKHGTAIDWERFRALQALAIEEEHWRAKMDISLKGSEEYFKALEELQENHRERMREMGAEEEDIDRQEDIDKISLQIERFELLNSTLNSLAGGFSNAAAALDALGLKAVGGPFAKVAKGIAKVQAAISLAQSFYEIALALQSLAAFDFRGFIQHTAAATAFQQSEKAGKTADAGIAVQRGGFVPLLPGADASRDSVAALLQPGELIIPKPFAEEFSDVLGRRGRDGRFQRGGLVRANDGGAAGARAEGNIVFQVFPVDPAVMGPLLNAINQAVERFGMRAVASEVAT